MQDKKTWLYLVGAALLLLTIKYSDALLGGVRLFFSLLTPLLVGCGTVWGGFERLLEEGEYTREEKKKQPLVSKISQVYWMLALAGYLAYSFITNDWNRSWIVWPVAAVLFPAVTALILLFAKKK